jgi:molybdate transport system regulatory protein
MIPVDIKIRIPQGDLFAFGPGKAALLEAIERCHSIAAAGRGLGLSYTKTRRMLDELNRSFRQPLVESVRGGAHGGGARVTAAGLALLATFRAMERRAQEAVQEDLRTLEAELRMDAWPDAQPGGDGPDGCPRHAGLPGEGPPPPHG